MKDVKVSLNERYCKVYFWHLERSAPSRRHQWQDIRFHFEPDCDACDAWVVWQSRRGLAAPETVRCPPENTILVTREPPDILQLPPAYLRQFGTVIAPDARIRHSNHWFQQFGQVWHLEKDYDELTAMDPPEKSRLLSSVTSAKNDLPGHQQRLQLLEQLQQYFGNQLERFGRGANPIKNKWDAVATYKYHLVLENGCWPHYWTEKLVDAYLGWCLPIYAGAPNIHEYFEPQSLITIDPARPDDAIARIERALAQDAWSQALPAIARARQRILHEYHLYAVLAEAVRRLPGRQRQRVTLYPEFQFRFPLGQQLRWRWRNVRSQLADRLGRY